MASLGKEIGFAALTALAVVIGAPLTGGYLDMANNTRDPETSGSDLQTVNKYEQKIQTILESKDTLDKQALSSVANDFFSSAYKTSKLSEQNILDLTNEFTNKIGDPTEMISGLTLEHPEYLNECQADIRSRNLQALDNCTMQKHQENINDGPWIGAMVGAVTVYTLGTPLFILLYLSLRGGAAGVGVAADSVKKLGKDVKETIKPNKFKH